MRKNQGTKGKMPQEDFSALAGYVHIQTISNQVLTQQVFAMLWHENAGNQGTALSPKGPVFTKGKYQEPIYSSIRRMVVIKEQKGCCWCMCVSQPSNLDPSSDRDSPITTYSGQGVAKAGIDHGKHALIRMRGSDSAMGKIETENEQRAARGRASQA